jgi:hypothetical protein
MTSLLLFSLSIVREAIPQGDNLYTNQAGENHTLAQDPLNRTVNCGSDTIRINRGRSHNA